MGWPHSGAGTAEMEPFLHFSFNRPEGKRTQKNYSVGGNHQLGVPCSNSEQNKGGKRYRAAPPGKSHLLPPRFSPSECMVNSSEWQLQKPEQNLERKPGVR